MPHVVLSLHSETLPRFRDGLPLFLIIKAVCLAEKQQIPIFSLLFDRTGAGTHDRDRCWNPLKDVDSRVFTRMLRGKHLTR